MEIPSEVLVHCDVLNLKGAKGRLLGVSPHGYYELNVQFGDRRHRTLLPVTRTVIISTDAEATGESAPEIER
jgi:hypothetical protein